MTIFNLMQKWHHHPPLLVSAGNNASPAGPCGDIAMRWVDTTGFEHPPMFPLFLSTLLSCGVQSRTYWDTHHCTLITLYLSGATTLEGKEEELANLSFVILSFLLKDYQMCDSSKHNIMQDTTASIKVDQKMLLSVTHDMLWFASNKHISLSLSLGTFQIAQ